MRVRVSCLIVAAWVGLAPYVSSSLAGDGEWITLFDGKTLTGWHKNPQKIGHGTGGEWKVEPSEDRWEEDLLAGVEVLVVDGDQDARDLIANILASCGASVVPAPGAAEALARIEARRHAQRRVGAPEPAQHLAQRVRAGPGLGVADGDLPAVGPAGLQGRARPALDHLDLVAGARQPPRAGHPDDARAEDGDFHRRTAPR